MLRAVRLTNFIKFKEDQILQFCDDGVYLFVGENNTGKSSVFEAVRRCMDMKSNFNFSMNVADKERPAYVICDFSLPDDTGDQIQGQKKILTSFVYFPKCNSAKISVITNGGDSHTGIVNMDIIITGDYLHNSANHQCHIEEQEKSSLIENLKKLLIRKDENSEQFLKTVSKVMERNETSLNQRLRSSISIKEASIINTDTERDLNALSAHIVFTFGLRAVGGVQWSKSSNLRKGEDNYSATTERCEIIRWFSEREGDDNYDSSKSEEIFKTLTGGESFTFYFDKRDGKELLLVKNGRGQTFSILKCPEGILEAKHISLLLSYKPFQTLLLEEPDRGMHPQMIHRLRSIILAAEKKKTIIIVSHNSAFISPVLIPRTFKFCKISKNETANSDTNDLFHIVNIGNVIKQMKEPIPRISNESYANVLFAKRVIFVEGESDYTFIRAMFLHILNPGTEDSTKIVFHLVSELNHERKGVSLSQSDFKMLKYLITSLYIVKLDGHGDKEKWHEFCKATYTPHIFVLDADSVVETVTSKASFDNSHRRACDIHDTVCSLFKKRITHDRAIMISNFLRKKFLQKNPATCDCIKFSDEDMEQSKTNIFDIAQSINFEQENVDMEGRFGEIDARFYGKIYAEKIRDLIIQEPDPFEWKAVSKITGSGIVTEAGKNAYNTFLINQNWIDARNELLNYNLFIWKDGTLEDMVLDVIVATEEGEAQMRVDKIFRKYLAFLSLKINLPPETFHKEHKKKLYLTGAGISEDNIQSSIDLVFKFCKKDSDIVNFLHYLTMNAME